MKYEQAVYNDYKTLIQSNFLRKKSKLLFSVSSVLFFATLGTFIYANILFKERSLCLKSQILEKEKNRTNASWPEWRPLIPEVDNERTLTINESKIINVKISKYNDFESKNGENRIYQEVEVASSREVLLLDQEVRNAHNFEIENITISSVECLSKFVPLLFLDYFLDYQTIIYNEIFHTFSTKKSIFIKNLQNMDMVEWNSEDFIQQFILEKKSFLDALYKILVMLKILIGMFILSNMTSLITRLIYISGPILQVLLIKSIFRNPLRQRLLDLLNNTSFSWYQIYTHDNQAFRKFDLATFVTFILTVMFFSFLFTPCSFLCISILLPDNTPEILQPVFFVLVSINEYFSFIFLRTRTSIKFFPPAINLVIFSFLFYVNCNVYPFFHLSMYLLIYSCIILMTGTLIFVEFPSRYWVHFKPDYYSPRMMYLPVFSLNWMKELPHLWTMFFPLYGRSNFTEPMLSLVDNTLNRHEFNNLDDYNLRNRNMYTYDTLYLLRNSDSEGLANINEESQPFSAGGSDFDDF